MKIAAAIEKQSMYPSTTMTGTGCDSSQEINTAQSPVGGMNRHRYRHQLSPETVPLSLVPPDSRALHVRSGRAACPAISALNNEYARAHDLRPIPAERTRLQYRDDFILFHLLLADCPSPVTMSSLAILGQKRRAPCKRGGDLYQECRFDGP
jgi:hypothetical protein